MIKAKILFSLAVVFAFILFIPVALIAAIWTAISINWQLASDYIIEGTPNRR